MSFFMRAILHDHEPNPYYGHWLGKNARKHAAKWGAIARNGLVASARFVTFDIVERDFPGNLAPARRKIVCRPKRKSARQANGALPATTCVYACQWAFFA